jgi:alkylation response protein AidB-like acyl-CoA dehydrogenase
LTPEVVRLRAERVADEVFFPAALEVDRADRIPSSHLDLLATEGLYGVAAPRQAGGLGLEDMASAAHLVQTLASGCLATAFVWIQHHGCVIASAASQQRGVRERWLAPLARGEVRAGIAYAGVRGGPSRAMIRRTSSGFVLDGEIPWVSGWDMIDVMHVAAVDDEDIVHFLIVDATTAPSLGVSPLELVAAQASRTVTVRLLEHEVAADRLTGTQPYAEWEQEQAAGSPLNGFLALGVVQRCRRLLAIPGWLDTDLAACRSDLLSGTAARIVAGRAAASELALRAAAALAVHVGSRSVLRSEHTQRLLREAAFLLVFGSRPAIRETLLNRFTA